MSRKTLFSTGNRTEYWAYADDQENGQFSMLTSPVVTLQDGGCLLFEHFIAPHYNTLIVILNTSESESHEIWRTSGRSQDKQ